MTAPARFDLGGLVALVTGASSGIGREIAGALAEAGAAVVLVARRAQQLAAAQREVEAVGARAATLTADLANGAAVLALAERASSFFGAPDIVVNAAGINIRKPMLEVTRADWDAILAINLTTPFFLAQALAPAMIAKGWGRIINIASLQSVRAFPMGAPYGASKGGIAQLTRAQAEAWSRHGVNSERDSARVLCNRTDGTGGSRHSALAEDGRQHICRAQWRARRFARHCCLSRKPRIGLRHRPNDLR